MCSFVEKGLRGSDLPQHREHSSSSRRIGCPLQLHAIEYEIEKFVVLSLEQLIKTHYIIVGKRVFVAIEKTGEKQVVFEKTAPGTPAQATPARRIGLMRQRLGIGRTGHRGIHDQTERRTISSLILPIARVGFSPLGHTSTQFMMVWQRNRR